jgi:uncharacterized protein (TIGR02145 family)
MKKRICHLSILYFFAIVLFTGCEKEIKPILYTELVSGITSTSAVVTYQITFEGNATFKTGGICWGDKPGPTINNNYYEYQAGKGAYDISITGLTQNTAYYVRAYAENANGISYGNELSFKTRTLLVPVYGTSPADADGNVYTTVKIGDQEWFAENLKTTKFRNGNSIPSTVDPYENILSVINPIYQWPSGGDESYVETYGRLYTWYAIGDDCEVCPDGWHVPTQADWNILYNFLGGAYIAGGMMKAQGTDYWMYPNEGATNESGFTGLPAGIRDPDGYFNELSFTAYWWTSTTAISYGNDQAWMRGLMYNYSSASDTTSYSTKNCALSVRCIKD